MNTLLIVFYFRTGIHKNQKQNVTVIYRLIMETNLFIPDELLG